MRDTGTPTSAASAPSSATAGSVSVSYTAADNQGGSGLAKVDLYVEAPGRPSYSKVATDNTPGGSGTFNYTAENDSRNFGWIGASQSRGNRPLILRGNDVQRATAEMLPPGE